MQSDDSMPADPRCRALLCRVSKTALIITLGNSEFT